MPPRTLQADEAIERRFDARRRRCLDERLEPADAAEVGLIVGKQRGASARGAELALACVPTPPCADGGLAIAVRVVGGGGGGGGGKKGSGGGGASSSSSQPSLSSLTLDAEWIAEHARQVARMLPGGLSILGIFVFCPDGAFGNAGAPALRAAAAAVAGALAPLPPQELLLLHCDSSPSAARKQSLRSLDVPVAPSAPLKPADLKFAAAAAAAGAGASLVELRCRHAFDVRVSASPGQALHAALQQAAESEARRVAETPGLAAVGGSSSRLQLPLGGGEGADGEDGGSISGPSLGDWLAQQAQGAVDDSCVEVSLLLPPPSASSAAISHGGGEARLRGVVVGLAYASRRDGAAGALERLRADVARSLMLRAELAQEEALAAEEEEQEEAQEEQQEEEGKEKKKRKKKKKRRHPLLARAAGSSGEGADATPVQLALARRVLVPWSPRLPAGPQLHLSEYVLPGEDASEAPTRAAELLFGSNGAAAAAEDVAGAAALEAATAEEVEDGDPPLTGGSKGRSSKATAAAAPPPAARSAAAVAFSADAASPSAAAAGCGGTVAASAAAAAAAAVLAVAVGSYLALG
jgi:hypothetical protein